MAAGVGPPVYTDLCLVQPGFEIRSEREAGDERGCDAFVPHLESLSKRAESSAVARA